MLGSLAYHRLACALGALLVLATTALALPPRSAPAAHPNIHPVVEPPRLIPAAATPPETLPAATATINTGEHPSADAFPATSHAAAIPGNPPTSTQPPSAPNSANRGTALPLPPRQPRSTNRARPGLPASGPRSRQILGPNPSLVTVAGSLLLVVGMFLVVAWALRRSGAAGPAALPGDVIEVLGRAPLPGKQQSIQLIRCGNKLVLVALSPAGADPLTEITDPTEVERLAGLCRQAHPHSNTQAFQQVLEQLGREPHAPGFLGDLEASRATRRRTAHAARTREATYG